MRTLYLATRRVQKSVVTKSKNKLDVGGSIFLAVEYEFFSCRLVDLCRKQAMYAFQEMSDGRNLPPKERATASERPQEFTSRIPR
jgi:hypothetical protein